MMYDPNQQYPNQNGGFDRESGTYHYSYTPQYSAPTPAVPPKKKSRRGLRAVALVLCCALVGGGAGVGGAALYSSLSASGGDSAPGVVIYQNQTDPVPVRVQQADGLTPMSLSEIYAAYADACAPGNPKEASVEDMKALIRQLM